MIAGLFPLDVLGELISIGILLAFAAVCAGVLVLRYTSPGTVRPFRVPAAWFTCIAGVVVCLGMTVFLPRDTWIRLVIWTGIGSRRLLPLRLPPQPPAPHGCLNHPDMARQAQGRTGY